MMIKLHLTISLLICSVYAQAQGIIVNSDGTHSVVINNGSTSTVVNANGTHSTAINNGSTSTIINPNGTHSTAFHNGTTSIIVNPDGTHSIGMNVGAATVTPQNNTNNEQNQGNNARLRTWNNDEDYWFSEPKVREKKVKKRSKNKQE